MQRLVHSKLMSTPSTQDGHAMGMRNARVVAVEFVTPGHPDKVCDQIGDSILDAAITQDPLSRVALETTGGHGLVMVNGEMTTKADLDIVSIVQRKYAEIGHDRSIEVLLRIVQQSPDIAQGVDDCAAAGKDSDEQGAGDQGVMVGYAIGGEANFMPQAYNLAKALTDRLTEVRVRGILPHVKADGKSQVTLVNGVVTRVTIAAHHSDTVGLEQLRADILKDVVQVVIPGINGDAVTINGTGKFVQGGFEADAGTTGRKLAVDNYGPLVEIGGGCYSGKDPSKVDRSAAYFCRMVAKAIVAGGHANEAVVKVGYAIGVAKPTFLSVLTPLDGEAAEKFEAHVLSKFDFRPKAIIERLGLRKPDGWCYADTAAAGHYGDDRFPWEKVVEI
ncbi:MAG: methionine adenosyltransferase [Patescibacteria group bacterium]|nr:methionine adenosyltransferase [Patescibacteria group bacterium]